MSYGGGKVQKIRYAILLFRLFIKNRIFLGLVFSIPSIIPTESRDYTYENKGYMDYLGNRWSDYAGDDANEDGIGDTPYEISGDNPDGYPLVNVFGTYYEKRKRN